MLQELFKSAYRFTDLSGANTDYDVFFAPTDESKILIKTPFIANNTSSTQILTIKIWKYDSGSSSYVVDAQDQITLNAGDNTNPAILSDLCLVGSTDHPDKVSIAFNNSINSGESIDCLFTYIKFSQSTLSTPNLTPPIDADTLDGYTADMFVKTSGNETIGGDKTFTNSVDVQGNLLHNGSAVLDTNSQLKDLSDVDDSLSPNNGDVLKYNSSTGKWEAGVGGSSSSTFLDLTDTPASYSGQAGNAVIVKNTEDGLEFSTISVSDEKVKSDATDGTPGYLSDKVDNATIEVDTTNHYLKVKSSGISATELADNIDASSKGFNADKVDGYDAVTTPTASSIPVADGTGKLDAGWIPDQGEIHDNVAGEINALTEKTSPVDNDILLIEDSEDSYNKKKIKIASINTNGSSDIQIPVAEMDPDDTDVGVSEGKAFGAIPTIDFDPDNDGAVWFNCRADRFWDVSNNITLQLSYILSSVSSGNNVLLHIDVYELDNNSDSLTNILSTDITIPDTNSGKLEINDLANFTISTTDTLLVFKVTRKASDSNDTYASYFKLVKAVVKQ